LSRPGDQAPIECTNVVPLGEWQDPLNSVAQSPSHVLRAQDRAPEWGKLTDPGLKARGFVIAVECDHVSIVQLNATDRAAVLGISPVPMPDSSRQRLTRIN